MYLNAFAVEPSLIDANDRSNSHCNDWVFRPPRDRSTRYMMRPLIFAHGGDIECKVTYSRSRHQLVQCTEWKAEHLLTDKILVCH